MSPLIILIVLVLVIGFYIVSLYNGMQSLLTQIEAAIQEIGNQLKRQADLIPNLETSVKSYMKQEKDIFSMLTDARKSVNSAVKTGSAADISKADSQMQALSSRLQVIVESNPQIQSNQTIQQFMSELRDTADKLTYSRRAVIDLTQEYNQKLVTFPSNLFAGMFGFKKQKGMATPTEGAHLEVSEAETKNVKVNL